MFRVHFIISNRVYKTWFSLFKFNFELKLGKNRNKFGVENWKHGNLISGARRKGLEEKSWVERVMLKESSLIQFSI